MDLNSRSVLQEIRKNAIEFSDATQVRVWKMAYQRLAGAVDCIDAMIARTEVAL